MAISTEYAAGFFDGEGSISIRSGPKNWWQVVVRIGQNDRRPLELIQERWHGKIQVRKSPSGVWYSLAIHTRQAYAFISEIRPFLIVKAESADVVIEFYEKNIMPVGRGNSRWTTMQNKQIERHRRSELSERLKLITARRGRVA